MDQNDIIFLKQNIENIAIVQNDSSAIKIQVKNYEAGDCFEDYLTDVLDLESSSLQQTDSSWIFIFDSPSDEVRQKLFAGLEDLSRERQKIMTRDELIKKLKQDVETCSGMPWPKDLSKHLVMPPRLEKFDELGEHVEMWTVFDEKIDSTSDGYLILFDPEMNDYCLAVKGANIEGLVGTVIGHYGDTLKEAIEGM